MDQQVFLEYTVGWIHSSWKTGAGEHPILNLVLRPNKDKWHATVDQIFQSNTEDTSMLPWVMNSLKSYASFPLARGTWEHISAAPALAYNPMIWLGGCIKFTFPELGLCTRVASKESNCIETDEPSKSTFPHASQLLTFNESLVIDLLWVKVKMPSSNMPDRE